MGYRRNGGRRYVGTTTAVLTITDNATGSPQKVNLTGTVVSATQQLALSQTSVAFGNQTTGTAGAPQVVYLVDMGSSNAPSRIQINSITLGGTDPGDFSMSQNCGGTLGFTAAGRSACMITVGFAPGTSSTGARTASVTITPVGESPLVIQLTGTGVAP